MNNLTLLRQHFAAAENIATEDVTQIIEDAQAVFESCLCINTAGASKGLIYGHIQSGKTAVILALIAIAADHGYRRFILLTSDLNDLYDQTLDRTKHTLHGLSVLGKTDLSSSNPVDGATATVLVLSKNVHVLDKVLSKIADSQWGTQSVMIIDDEADQASLDTTVNKPQTEPKGVNLRLTQLRGALESLAFIQTTATPQALLLQDPDTPFRPDFVRVTTPGRGYCGGEVFFGSNILADSPHLEFVPDFDPGLMRTDDTLPESLRAAICEFFIAAACLRLISGPRNYQALIHTSLKKAEHSLVTKLVDEFTRKITIAIMAEPREIEAPTPEDHANSEIRRILSQAYQLILDRGTTPPPFSEVLAEVRQGIASTSVIQINSFTGQGVERDPGRRQIIYIGGTKLGRGVTIKNLLLTYYARDAQSPQIDTVLQHARMYGYRRNELEYTRIFLPIHLAERFKQIHIADNSMREMARTSSAAIPVIPIPLRSLKPARRNVLSKQSVELTTYIGGRQYFPLSPLSEGPWLASQTHALDTLLLDKAPDERTAYNVSISDLVELLEFRFGAQRGLGAWDDELVRQAMGLLHADGKYANRAQLVVGSRTSQVGRLTTRGGPPQLQALLPANAGNPPYGTRRDIPVLVFMRLDGKAEKDWNGFPFWVPNVRFPEGNYAFSLNRKG